VPRTVDVVPARWRRQLRLLGGAVVDRVAELWFLAWHRPGELLHDDTEATHDRLRIAIDRGARFLRQHQRGDGSWCGFLLYPGASTAWLTAHVAFALDDVPQLREDCRRAAAFLQSIGAHDGGWGYNRRVGIDCDSWSQALMVLAKHSLPFEDFLVCNLASAQLNCGGYPTYPSEGRATSAVRSGWQAAHPEVTALVAEALRRRGGFEDRVDRCLRWLRKASTEGVLRSYWWPDECYSLWVQARTHLLGPAAAERVQAVLLRNDGVPQLAMGLTAAVELGFPDESLADGARKVLGEQRADGSWFCAPCLRVTHPTHVSPGPDAPGAVFADRRRVFSTAHAVAALDRVARQLFPHGH
jgi:hypothetical protein